MRKWSIGIAGDQLQGYFSVVISDHLTLKAEVSKEFEGVLLETEKSIICAPLKEIRRSPYGWLLILKHLPGLRFWVTDKVGSSAESMSHGQFRMDSFQGYALCLLEVRWGNTAGSFTVVALSVRTTDISFMPCSSESAATVASQLRAEGNSFVSPLYFDAPDDIALADYAILDDVMTPIFVLSSSGNAVQDAAKRSLVGLLERNRAQVRIITP